MSDVTALAKKMYKAYLRDRKIPETQDIPTEQILAKKKKKKR